MSYLLENMNKPRCLESKGQGLLRFLCGMQYKFGTIRLALMSIIQICSGTAKLRSEKREKCAAVPGNLIIARSAQRVNIPQVIVQRQKLHSALMDLYLRIESIYALKM